MQKDKLKNTMRFCSTAKYTHSKQGFTLIEMLIALAVAGILAMIVWPQYTQSVRTQVLSKPADELYSRLRGFRQIALDKGRTVTVSVKDADGNNTLDDSWNAGVIAFFDDDSDGLWDATEETVGGSSSYDSNLVFSVEGSSDPSQLTRSIRFNSTGIAAFAGTGRFSVCDNNQTEENGWEININISGIIRKAPYSGCD